MKQYTIAERNALPDTYGIPVNDPYTLHTDEVRRTKPPRYGLSYESATEELDYAIQMGLHNYGTGIASSVIPRILKSPGAEGQRAWELYVWQVCGGGYTRAQIRKAWDGYTPAEKARITEALEEYLEDCFTELTNNVARKEG